MKPDSPTPMARLGSIEPTSGGGGNWIGASTAAATARRGLWIFLGVLTSLFLLFIAAYLMRMHFGDWHSLPKPRLLWLNTATLVASSAALQIALVALRHHRRRAAGFALLAGVGFALAFLLGQWLAWRQLQALGYFVAGNPANSFFYLITAVHGAHLLGGLVALARATAHWRGAAPGQRELSLQLCARYWHFLLAVWLVLFALLLVT